MGSVSHYAIIGVVMARPLRLEVSGGLYHVIARGNERKAIFRDDRDRAKYLERLAFYREKFGFQLLGYCLMGNHVHLAIETGKVPLSKVMAGQQSSYTQYFNWRHERVGHLFQGRYKAFLVEKDPYALALIRYIHDNPLKAGLVEKAEQYGWSSDRFYRSGKGPAWLDMDRILRMLGRSRSGAVREYRRLMRESGQCRQWGQSPIMLLLPLSWRARCGSGFLAVSIMSSRAAMSGRPSSETVGIGRSVEEELTCGADLRRALARIQTELLRSDNSISVD